MVAPLFGDEADQDREVVEAVVPVMLSDPGVVGAVATETVMVAVVVPLPFTAVKVYRVVVERAGGFGAVVVDSGAVAPPVGGEVERHGVVLLAVGRGGLVIDGAVGLHGPGEITAGGVARLVAIHIGLGPIPDGVEFLFFVHLDGDHHAVGHALAAHIMMGDVGYVGKLAVGVFAALIVDGFGVGIAVEQLLEGRVDLLFYVDRKSTRLNSSHLGIS